MSTDEPSTDRSQPTDEDPLSGGERPHPTPEDVNPWYGRRLGLGILAFDLLLTLVVVVGSTSLLGIILDALIDTPATLEVVIPWYVYVFGLLGALGYVFTAQIREFPRDTVGLLKDNLRLPAAIPLCAGLYLLSELILGTDPPAVIVAGLVFVGGLYVNLTYERIGMVADRLLPGEGGDADGTGDDTDSADGSEQDE